MSTKSIRKVRCAIYTRKSSEEGLEQSFNSLDAQREACAAYIQSQRHEGWMVLDTHYDDGGYSGGSMERPALQRLLEDIHGGKINTIVVYKVDRLTRSLTDFAKIVEILDHYSVTFVSVTQHFNTTTSMGRLTLNVLLSFAQFEREVTGERIRDKIAASKRKGMWMGGVVPLGYDVRDRTLVPNPEEAALVRHIYESYVLHGSVAKLKSALDAAGINSKLRPSLQGVQRGGRPFSRGALYTILSSRLYLGEIIHRDKVYPGQHSAIIEVELWNQVQRQLKANIQAKQTGVRAREPSLLAGLLYDSDGHRLTPSHAAKGGKRYRYYVSQGLIHRRHSGLRTRIPAAELENTVLRRITAFLGEPRQVLDAALDSDEPVMLQEQLRTAARDKAEKMPSLSTSALRAHLSLIVHRITVSEEQAIVHLSRSGLRSFLLNEDTDTGNKTTTDDEDHYVLELEIRLQRCKHEMRIILPKALQNQEPPHHDPALIKAVARGWSWYEQLTSGQVSSLEALAKQVGVHKRYVSRVIRVALLAPDIVQSILAGTQPSDLTLNTLLKGVPPEWSKQREALRMSRH